jgi:hypothetical protein
MECGIEPSEIVNPLGIKMLGARTSSATIAGPEKTRPDRNLQS